MTLAGLRKVRPGAWMTALLVAILARLWLMPLGSSFWIDEMATVFVVRHGAGDPSLAVAPQVPHSIYYWLPRLAEAMLGFSEVVYRLPSVLAMGIALAVVARLAARLIHPQAGWFAAFACVALSGFDYQAADARPYGLGTCVAAAGVLFLVRWLDEARWRDGLLFALFAALLWRVHLIFWPFYLMFAGYAALRLWRGESRASWPRTAAIFGLAALALVPVLMDALALLREAKAHVIVKPPSLHEFEHALRWNVVAICGGGAWILSRLFRWKSEKPPISPASIALFVGWWLCQPACLFAFSWLTGNSVFVKRYIFPMLPGVALTATAAAARFIPGARWNRLAALVGAGGLLALGQWGQLWPVHENSDWRAAAREVNALALAPDTPVICPSPFIEARPPEWRPDYPLPGFLYAQLPVYPIAAKAFLFPFETSPEAERYALELTGGALSHSRRFMLYGGNGATRFWRKWLAGRAELAGWRTVRHAHGDVDVVVFEPGPGASGTTRE
jgi:hypothetical protein